MNDAPFPQAVLQQWMQAMITHQAAGSADNLATIRVPDVVNASERLSAGRHFDIYRSSYIARLRECMRNQFGALAYALGTELFEAFTDQYLHTYPSHSYSLNTLGFAFAAFLQQTRPDAEEQQKESWPDFMIELAAFEYALSLIFDEDSTEECIAATEDTPDEQLILTPVFYLFHHRYPICKYYLEYSRKAEPELPFPEESWCVITRINYRLGLFVIKPAQFRFLSALKDGCDIDGAKKAVMDSFHFTNDEIEILWAEWKKFFVASGFFAAEKTVQ